LIDGKQRCPGDQKQGLNCSGFFDPDIAAQEIVAPIIVIAIASEPKNERAYNLLDQI
jgi:hypothetical protein